MHSQSFMYFKKSPIKENKQDILLSELIIILYQDALFILSSARGCVKDQEDHVRSGQPWNTQFERPSRLMTHHYLKENKNKPHFPNAFIYSKNKKIS